MKYNNLTLELSDSTKLATLYADNGRKIFEILIHGDLASCIDNSITNKPIVKGRSNIFRGECFQLASWETLDIENERVGEK